MAGTDYGDSLRTTLDAARKQILDLGQSTLATRQQAAITLGHAEQALSVAENGLDRNQDDLKTAYTINDMSVQGGALIQSADQLADLARTAADSVNAALSVAATSIKTLASAFDTLANSIAGVNAIASNDDYGSAMARAAKKAEDATDGADNTVEQLKAASLSASIQSAKSMAAAAATSVTAVGSEIQGLVDRAGALLAATQQRVNDSMKQRAAAAQSERAAQTTYRQAKIDSEALDDGTTNMDVFLNGGLVVQAVPVAPTPPAPTPPGATPPVPTPPIPTPPGARSASPTSTSPYLTATYTVNGATTDRCYFFALPESDAPGFSYNDAKTAVIEFDVNPSSFVGWTPTLAPTPVRPVGQGTDGSTQTYTVNIANWQNTPGDNPDKSTPSPIACGQSYRVFAYRVPQGGPYATNASDLSSPSRTIEVWNAIPNLGNCKVSQGRTGSDPFNVQVTLPKDASAAVMECRAFVFLEDVYQAVKDDVAFLTGLLPASSYKASQSSSSSWQATSAGATVTFSYQEGDTDAYGDIITADTNYRVLVMLVPRQGDTAASALLPALPVRWTQPASPTSPAAPSGPASPTPPGSAPARATTSAGKPTPDSAAPSAGQTPSGTGAK